MDKETAIALWQAIEKKRAVDEFAANSGDGNIAIPLFDVRLDASADGNEERIFRVRVSNGPGWPGVEGYSDVLALAAEVEDDIHMLVQNNGIELS